MGCPSQDVTDSKFTDFEEYVDTVTVRIQARRMEIPFTVRTSDGVKEGKCGDWLAIGAAGERYIIRDEIFKKIHAPVLGSMEDDAKRQGQETDSDHDMRPFQGNCPYTACPTECKAPIFATGFHVCGSDQSTAICFNFRHKLLVTIVVDRGLAKTLIQDLETDFKDDVVKEGGGEQ
jgi:hypothetical protein